MPVELLLVPLYEGMAAYAAACTRACRGSVLEPDTRRKHWQAHVIEPYWSQWAGGQFNEARVRDQWAEPIIDHAGLARDAAVLAAADLRSLLSPALTRLTETLSPAAARVVVALAALDPANSYVRARMQGVVGQCVGDSLLPQVGPVVGWTTWLPYHLAHEYHHSIWGYPYFALQGHTGIDLLAMLLSEGMADGYAQSLYPQLTAPWASALTPEQEASHWRTLQPLLGSAESGLYERFMFGDENTPAFTGYTIGYSIVQRYLAARPGMAPADWLAVEPAEMLAQSGYDGRRA